MALRRHRLSACAVALFALVSTKSASADPRGIWLARDGAHVRVSSCGKNLCGTVVRTKSPVDPETGRPWTDKSNPNPALRNRPLLGVEVFIAMMPDGEGKWSGTLYDTDRGQTVPGHLLDIDRRTLRVEGCAGALCGGQNMSRIK